MSQISNFSINQSHQKSHHKNLSQGASKPSSKLPLISKTPGPGSPQNYSKALQSEKNDFELELNTKHRILKSMLDIEKQSSSHQDTSSLGFSFKRMSAGMKIIGNYNDKADLMSKVFENLPTTNETSVKLFDTNAKATKICINTQHNT